LNMPLRLDIKRKLSERSDRVKNVDFHPTEPWVLACLYNGNVHIWNYETKVLVKTFEVTELPVRTAKFVARKNWLIAGADDMFIRVFNYNTHEKVAVFEAHSDYIRSIAVHPTQSYVLTSSDDMLIKLWDWDNGWKNIQVFEGHSHYVMQVAFNPKDTNTFASASLDRTVKIWNLGSAVANFTLEGHEKGVNCVDYYAGGDKPYIVTGSDDKLVKVWDYQNKACVQTLEGHSQNISVVCFHPELPIILSGSEDGTVRIWHANTYRLENTLNYGLERVWAIAYLRGSNDIALGYDEGTIVIKLGREEPAVSMDNTGKIIWAHHNEIQTTNIKSGSDEVEVNDGERIPLAVKDLGSCEVYPQTLKHNPNGRFVVVCGDGEYIIYTAVAWRNKSFGSALEFAWASDSNQYAVRESSSKVKFFKNFKEKKSIKPNFSAEGIFGGACLGVRSGNFLCFFDWESTNMVRRIDVLPKDVHWNESGELLSICGETNFYILKYNKDAVEKFVGDIPEEGIENAFDVVTEIQEGVKTACWVGDCFIYTNSSNRLSYFVGGQVNTVAHFDRTLYLLGYIPKNDRLYLVDKDLNVVSYKLSLNVLEYQTAILRGDIDTAQQILPNIHLDQRNKIARFLESQNLPDLALEVSADPEHRFELAVQLKKLEIAFEIAVESDAEGKWKQLADLTLAEWKLDLAENCLKNAKDYSGLLLLYVCTSNPNGMLHLATFADENGKYNISFLCYYLLGKADECLELLLKTGRVAEAGLMSRTFVPSKISEVLYQWKKSLGFTHRKAADSLADPSQFQNLFPDFELALKAEELLRKERSRKIPSTAYEQFKDSIYRDVIEEVRSHPNGDGDHFEEGEAEEEEEEEEGEGEGDGEDERHGNDLSSSNQEKNNQNSNLSNQPGLLDSKANQIRQLDDDISENFSMEANTAGTSSNKGDDLDDISSLGANEGDDPNNDANLDDDNFDDF